MPTIMEQLADIEERTEKLKRLLEQVDFSDPNHEIYNHDDCDHADEGGDFTGPNPDDHDR